MSKYGLNVKTAFDMTPPPQKHTHKRKKSSRATETTLISYMQSTPLHTEEIKNSLRLYVT